MLARLRDRPGLLATAGEIARRRFRSVFDIHAVADNVQAVYVNLCASAEPSGGAVA